MKDDDNNPSAALTESLIQAATAAPGDNQKKSLSCADKTQAILGWYLFNVFVVPALLNVISDGEIMVPLGLLLAELQGFMPAKPINATCVVPMIAPAACIEAANAPVRGMLDVDNIILGHALFQAAMLLASFGKSACVKYKSPMHVFSGFVKDMRNTYGEKGLVAVLALSFAAMVVRSCFDTGGSSNSPLALALLVFVPSVIIAKIISCVNKSTCCNKQPARGNASQPARGKASQADGSQTDGSQTDGSQPDHHIQP